MSITRGCTGCDLSYAVVLSTMRAHPGRIHTQRVLVPVEDPYGNRRGHRWEASGHWVPTGDSVTLTHRVEGTEEVYSWACPCGDVLDYRQPALEYVGCTYAPGASGYCRVHDRTITPPNDLYVNPAHGAACPCCGQQGGHWVRVDRDPASLPLCLS